MVELTCEVCGAVFMVSFEDAQGGDCFCPECGNFGK